MPLYKFITRSLSSHHGIYILKGTQTTQLQSKLLSLFKSAPHPPPPTPWGETADLHRLTSSIQTPEGHTHLTVFILEEVVLWSLARNREVSGERDYWTERKTHGFSLIWYWHIYKKFIFTFSMLTFLTNSLLGQLSHETLHITNKFNRPFWVAPESLFLIGNFRYIKIQHDSES